MSNRSEDGRAKRLSAVLAVVAIAVAVAGSVSACSNGQSSAQIEPNRTDTEGLIEYAMPDGWTNTRISTGNHYTREDRPDDPAILGVIPMQRGSVPSIEQIKEGTSGKHAIQGHQLISEAVSAMNGFDVWEAVYQARVRGRDVIYHDCFLFTDALQVEIHLNSTRDDYETFLPDLRTVVESVRVKAAGT